MIFVSWPSNSFNITMHGFKKEYMKIDCMPAKTKCGIHSLSVLAFIAFPCLGLDQDEQTPANTTQINECPTIYQNCTNI